MHPISCKICFIILQILLFSVELILTTLQKIDGHFSFLSLNSWETINKLFEIGKVDCREKNVALRRRLIDEAALQSFPPRCTQCITITIIMAKGMKIMITIPTIFYIFL